ncbi:MAG TPA: hypothetical protein VJH37_05090 [Candidatus Nanoarchaeia archaeon]|nr:hypothetical protein [Candidatus Nanoarchaeia archaeon]
MGLFNLFKKKEAATSTVPLGSGAAWQETSFQAAEAFREPLSPLSGLVPPPLLSLEQPQSFGAAETQTILAKLDVLAARLEQVNMRLEKIEQILRLQQPQQQSSPYQPIRRW